ncbi:serine protease inhibitor serpin [Holotrichia oblita]|uniref:Serine protease inhibitor serpin n=1 Tax=Holotrichia oblita TaxID=644536 RepID=A0ACB9TB12_HOLOL|nr:serine protease inhibitor serpin [Holotrichia oblita]
MITGNDRIPQTRTPTQDAIVSSIHQIRDTAEYDKRVEDIVTNGISNLAVAINNFYLNRRSFDNVVLSPVSIAGALALILLGSNGKTFDEIAHVMGVAAGTDITSKSRIVHESLGKLFSKLHRNSDLVEQINVAAAIFVQDGYPIRDLYRDMSERIYKNEILSLDFKRDGIQAQRAINSWVSNRTNGKIKTIIGEPPSDDTKIVIASALYFNGAWEKQFWEGFTRRRPFYPNGRKTQTTMQVEMMSNGGLFPYHKDITLDCDIMGFPYKGNATTMYVIIPQDSNVTRLRSFEASLTSGDILRLVKSTVYTQSVVVFPKMKVEATSDLREALQSLGIKSLFNPYEANLALLSPGYTQPNYRPVNNPTPSSRESVGRDNDVLIFSRFGQPINCTQIFNPNSNISECEEIDSNTQKQVTYKKFGDKLGRRVTRDATDSLDNLRMVLNRDPHNKNVENPGIYADQVLHKVYIDITEQGTEAAASTSVCVAILCAFATVNAGFAGSYGGDDDDHGYHAPETVVVQRPVHVPVYKHVPIPVPTNIQIPIPKPVPIGVPSPYPINVQNPQPIAVPMIKIIEIPVEKPVPYPVEKPVHVPIDKYVPVIVEKHIRIPVPKPVPVPVPVHKTIYHSGKH